MATRVVLIVIGIVSRALILPFTKHANVWLHTHQELLDMWIAWDGNWYLRVAGQWYPKGILSYGQTNYAFFPLYPFLIKVIGYILHSNVVAALFVANLSLIISGVLLYKLVLLDGDETVALRTIKYLFIFPSSFIFSGVLAESLYLMLLLVCFYYTRRQRLFRAGIAGFFLSLTKPYGILITLPMLYEYMLARNFNLGKIKLNIINMLLPVLGTLVFHLFCYCQTGDWLAYEHTKVSGWYHRLNNPLYTIAYALFKKPHNINVFFNR
ncbi:MAG: hypothetical protein NC923_07025 [Candidatus Omnitrophica bacterium]|nr:hypothetical protein [Candidatus Omnitrophota bacterium]